MKNILYRVKEVLENIDYNKLSIEEIAKLVGCNEKTIRIHLKTLGINKNICRVSGRDKISKIKECINLGMTTREISKVVESKATSITGLMVKNSITNPNKSRLIYLTDDEYQVIIGSLLGDGHIELANQAGRLRLKHSIKQRDYITYKEELLKRLIVSSISIRDRYDSRFKIPNYKEITLDTASYKSIGDIGKRWYTPIKKVGDDINNIQPLGLAIWFMDDGYKDGKSVRIATQSFSHNDILFIKDILLSKFNINVVISKDNTIRIKQNSYPTFYNLVKPFIINSMNYKLPELLTKNSAKRGRSKVN